MTALTTSVRELAPVIRAGINDVLPVTEKAVIATAAQRVGWAHVPSEIDALGPFYNRGMALAKDVRTDPTKQGHELLGTILDAKTGAPVKDAQVELWSVLPNETYDFVGDRGMQVTGADGAYKYLSDWPVPYQGRPSHVHVMVRADGYHGMVTQQYPTPGEAAKQLDIALEPVLPGQTQQLKVLGEWTPYQPTRPSGWVGKWND